MFVWEKMFGKPAHKAEADSMSHLNRIPLFRNSAHSCDETLPPSDDEIREFLTYQVLEDCGLPVHSLSIKYREKSGRLQLYLSPKNWSTQHWHALYRRVRRIKEMLRAAGFDVSDIFCSNRPENVFAKPPVGLPSGSSLARDHDPADSHFAF